MKICSFLISCPYEIKRRDSEKIDIVYQEMHCNRFFQSSNEEIFCSVMKIIPILNKHFIYLLFE